VIVDIVLAISFVILLACLLSMLFVEAVRGPRK